MDRHPAAGFSLIEMLMVVAIIGVLAAIAVPMSGNAIRYLKLSGDARSLSNEFATAKMRAAADFTQSRVYMDTLGKDYYLQTCNTPATSPCPSWTTQGGTTYLSSTVSFGYGPVATPPSNTQSSIGQPTACLNGSGVAVGNTACILFNSRGIPVSTGGSPTGNDAVYITDTSAVYGVTIAASGFVRTWQNTYTSTASWVQQ